jgi:hypothetical protein
MVVEAGFKISRGVVARSSGAKIALPEQGDASRLERISNSLKDLGEDRGAYITEISKLWGEAQDRFITIGRYLLQAKERLPHGAYEAMVAAELPFGKVVAWQLRTVAMAVDCGKLDEDALPRSYATAFKFAKMEDSVLIQARKEHLVRPDVSRAEVSRFLRRLAEEQQQLRPAHERLTEERDALRRRIQILAEAQREAKRHLSEVEAKLGGKTIEGLVVRNASE